MTGFDGPRDRKPIEVYVLKKPRDTVQLGMHRVRSFSSVSEAGLYTIIVRDGSWLDVDQGLRHVYAYYFVRGRFPTWLASGLAEYLTPERESQNLGYRTIGLPPRYLLKVLRLWEPWVPMQQMLAPYDFDDWPAGDRRMFYAQSWVLTHYLVNRPEYADNITKYLALLDSGQDSIPAFEATFGITTGLLKKEIHNYLRASRFVYNKFGMDELLPTFEPDVVTLSPTQVSLGLARIAFAFERLDQAQHWFEVAIADDETRPRAEIGIGRMLLSRDDYDSAEKRFELAIALAPDDAYGQREMGRYWQTRAEHASEPAQRAALFERARVNFTRSRELDDTIAETYALHGETFVTQGAFDKAIGLLETAQSLSPSSASVRVLLAESYAGVGLKDEAIRVARSVLAWTPDDEKSVARARKVLAAASVGATAVRQ